MYQKHLRWSEGDVKQCSTTKNERKTGAHRSFQNKTGHIRGMRSFTTTKTLLYILLHRTKQPCYYQTSMQLKTRDIISLHGRLSPQIIATSPQLAKIFNCFSFLWSQLLNAHLYRRYSADSTCASVSGVGHDLATPHFYRSERCCKSLLKNSTNP